MHEIHDLRNKLLAIDKQIIQLLKDRTRLEHQLAGFKKMTNHEEDLERLHADLIEKHKEQAQELRVNAALVQDIFERIYVDTRDIHGFLKDV